MSYLSDGLPVMEIAGGIMIGLAAVLLMGFNGRIMGVSGIAGGLMTPKRNDWAWRLMFIAGLAAAPVAVTLFGGSLPPVRMTGGAGIAAAAGLLVGYGTRLGSGCTSGHGVCGLARLSPRSLAAVIIFMVAGALVASLVHPLLGEV
ncbi:YeeE/YedE family protein [Pacificimonas sp. WHA3]|uniref:YeeE/YedE family protein n=1 Tax=Pacificimonas pallii TaxID=2827236 RepID=A0ABS6SFA4_9SPHN|nr:YeeE/YedE family protein [Pacificimonas pallii]MBV7256606.1 YeeE/YedE family protein [Pacificimonas pallii]